MSMGSCLSFKEGVYFFFFQAEDGIRDIGVTGVQTCALPIYPEGRKKSRWRTVCTTTKSAYRASDATAANVSCVGENSGRSEERRVGKSVDLGGRRIIKKKNT